MIHRRQFLFSALAASAGLSVVPTTVEAADYPNRVIRLVVPFAAGGGVDVFARLLAEKLKEKRGVTIIVENRAGANGSIGGALVRNSAPDGYTLLFSAATHVMAKQVMRSPRTTRWPTLRQS